MHANAPTDRGFSLTTSTDAGGGMGRHGGTNLAALVSICALLAQIHTKHGRGNRRRLWQTVPHR